MSAHLEPRSDPPLGVRPAALPTEHADLPALGGHIGPAPEDFVVDELPLYAPSGEGAHWYVRMRKKEASTRDLERAVAEAAGVRARDVGHAGMKDKHAVTTQWLSVPVDGSLPPAQWKLPPQFELLEVSRHENKLRVGHLAGNRFEIRLIDLPESPLPKVRRLADRMGEAGIGNYFGPQRFGHGQDNLDKALHALRHRRLGPRAGSRGKFLCSVIQSEIFNRHAMARLARGVDELLEGEVVRLNGSRALFAVEDPARERARLQSGDLHLTGPIWGPKMKKPLGAALGLELEALESLGFRDGSLGLPAASAPGTRRDLLLRPADFAAECCADGALRVTFSLPAGSYASLVIRALTRNDPWGRDSASPTAEG